MKTNLDSVSENGHPPIVTPTAPENETAAVASILCDTTWDAFDKVSKIAPPNMFVDPFLRLVMCKLADMRREGLPNDYILLVDRLKGERELAGENVYALVGKLAKASPNSANAAFYATNVRNAFKKLEVRQLGENILCDVDRGKLPGEIIADTGAAIFDMGRDNATDTAEVVEVGQFIIDNPTLFETLIDGLVRRAETLNLIAPPKVGKSWLAYYIALCVATGTPIFGRFPCRPGRVLIIDNELHACTLAHRIQTVAKAMGLRLEDYQDNLDVLSLRGRLLDLHGIAEILDHIEPGQFDLVILDAFYRALPVGVSENDNAQVAMLFNLIDGIAKRLGCSWINIHHSSKGSQEGKSVTDVGAGAGAQSRAADCHVVLRQHDEPDAVVLEAVVRSFAPVAPLVLRWSFPLWSPDMSLDPALLKGRKSAAEERQTRKDQEGCDMLLAAITAEPGSTPRALSTSTGMSSGRVAKLLTMIERDKLADWKPGEVNGKPCRNYFAKGECTTVCTTVRNEPEH